MSSMSSALWRAIRVLVSLGPMIVITRPVVAQDAPAPQATTRSAPASPATRPTAPLTLEKTLTTTMERVNQVLTEPLAPGATAAQAKVILAERGDQARRLAASIVGQKIALHIPVADVVETATVDATPGKTLSAAYKLAAKAETVLPLPPQVDKDWKQRSLDVAAGYNKQIAGFRRAAREADIKFSRDWQNDNASKAEANRNKALRDIQSTQTLWTPRATIIVVGDDAGLARRRGGEAIRTTAEIVAVELIPWSPVSAGIAYETWSKAGRMVVTVRLEPTAKE